MTVDLFMIFIDICKGVHSNCVDTEGSYICLCADGYAGDGETCFNVDECQDNIFNCSLYDVINGYGVSKIISGFSIAQRAKRG